MQTEAWAQNILEYTTMAIHPSVKKLGLAIILLGFTVAEAKVSLPLVIY
jgi:hypothetical protein